MLVCIVLTGGGIRRRLTDSDKGSNTNNTALMIGEKAAVLAAEYLGIEL
jgi:hypothetical protein